MSVYALIQVAPSSAQYSTKRLACSGESTAAIEFGEPPPDPVM